MSLHQIKKIKAKSDGKTATRKKKSLETKCDAISWYNIDDDPMIEYLNYWVITTVSLMYWWINMCYDALSSICHSKCHPDFFLLWSNNNFNKTTRTMTEQQWNWAYTQIMVPIHFVMLQIYTTRHVFLLLYISWDFKTQKQYSTVHRKRLSFECVSLWVLLFNTKLILNLREVVQINANGRLSESKVKNLVLKEVCQKKSQLRQSVQKVFVEIKYDWCLLNEFKIAQRHGRGIWTNDCLPLNNDTLRLFVFDFDGSLSSDAR